MKGHGLKSPGQKILWTSGEFGSFLWVGTPGRLGGFCEKVNSFGDSVSKWVVSGWFERCPVVFSLQTVQDCKLLPNSLEEVEPRLKTRAKIRWSILTLFQLEFQQLDMSEVSSILFSQLPPNWGGIKTGFTLQQSLRKLRLDGNETSFFLLNSFQVVLDWMEWNSFTKLYKMFSWQCLKVWANISHTCHCLNPDEDQVKSVYVLYRLISRSDF